MPAAAAGGAGGDFGRGHAFGARRPQHAVFDLVPPRVHRDVGDAERDEQRDDDDREHGSTPDEPAGLDGFGVIQVGIGHGRELDRGVQGHYDLRPDSKGHSLDRRSTMTVNDWKIKISSLEFARNTARRLQLNGAVHSILWIGWARPGSLRTSASGRRRCAWADGRRAARRRSTDPARSRGRNCGPRPASPTWRC